MMWIGFHCNSDQMMKINDKCIIKFDFLPSISHIYTTYQYRDILISMGGMASRGYITHFVLGSFNCNDNTY